MSTPPAPIPRFPDEAVPSRERGRLHRLHETELAKALDIQLGFNANDGD